MATSNLIKLLDASLLNDTAALQELTHWLRVMHRPNGWHYDLDHIWILQELAQADLQPGMTILDAGAGQGIMQFLLAARGYHVISLDFSPRHFPRRARGIFSLTGKGDASLSYEHPYMNFIKFPGNERTGKKIILRDLSSEKIYRNILLGQDYIKSMFSYWAERLTKNHSNYGTIEFVRAPFHNIPLNPRSVDAVISVSAIEHADIDLFEKNISSLKDLLKPQAPMLITTSATTAPQNVYDEKVQGWSFSQEFLKRQFTDHELRFDAETCARSLLESPLFRERIDAYYHTDHRSPFYQKIFTTLPYLPVAIKTWGNGGIG